METTLDCPSSDLTQVAVPPPLIEATPCSGGFEPTSSAQLVATNAGGELNASEVARCDDANPGTTAEEDQWPRDESRQEKKKRHTNRSDLRRNWMMEDPQGWIGMKVRSRRNFLVYTISQVYITGRVKLERNWLMYMTDVETIRKQYESYT